MLDELDDSTNHRITEYAEDWRKVIDQRTDRTAGLEAGKAGFDQTLDPIFERNVATPESKSPSTSPSPR